MPEYTVSYTPNAPVPLSPNTGQTGAYTLAATDANTELEMANASNAAVSVPTNASVPFPIGTVINIRAGGAGAVKIIAVNSGTTTINAPSSYIQTRAKYSTLSLYKDGTDTWVVSGDAVAATF